MAQDRRAPLPRLLPTPPSGAPSSSSSAQSRIPLPQTGSRVGRQPAVRSHMARAACERCRRKKMKCSAHRPTCTECAISGTECEYETIGNETRPQAIRRRAAELQSRTDDNGELMEILRSSSPGTANAVLDRLRSGIDKDIASLVRHVRHGDLMLQTSMVPDSAHVYVFPILRQMPSHLADNTNIPYLTSRLYTATAATRNQEPQPDPSASQRDPQESDRQKAFSAPFHSAQLAEPRISAIKAAKWTSVSHDDVLVQKLLQTYFTYDHPYYHILHMDLFLDDMANGRKHYCSSLLVNAVLAQACHGHADIIDRFKFWDPSSLGYRFLAEAKRLWELEAGRAPEITTVQAAFLICTNYAINGLDRIGNEYLHQAFAMAREMGVFGPLAEAMPDHQRKVYSVTAWGLYTMSSFVSFHFLQEPKLPRPPQIDLPTWDKAADEFGEVWVLYPQARAPIRTYHGLLVRALAELSTIMTEVARRSFSPAHKDQGRIRLEEALWYRTKLLAWYHSLPQPLTSAEIVFPAQLKLHMHYQNVLIAVFEPFKGIPAVAPPSSTPFPAQAAPAPAPTPSQVLADARARLETLVRLFYSRHGLALPDSTVTLFLLLAGNESLARLSSPGPAGALSLEDRDAAASTMVLCARGFLTQGRNGYLHQAVFHMFCGLMAPEQRRLVQQEVAGEGEEGAEGDGGGEGLGREFLAQYVRSQWPVNIVGVDRDPAGQELDRVIPSGGRGSGGG